MVEIVNPGTDNTCVLVVDTLHTVPETVSVGSAIIIVVLHFDHEESRRGAGSACDAYIVAVEVHL